MSARTSFSHTYIAAAQARIDAQVAAFDLVREPNPGFESIFFNNLVIVLDSFFSHRERLVEGNDGNALNEVRMLVTSMTMGDALLEDPSIRYKPSNSVLGLHIGAPIALNRIMFSALSSAYFIELDARYGSESDDVS